MSLLFIVMSYARRHRGDRKSRYLSQVRSEMSANLCHLGWAERFFPGGFQWLPKTLAGFANLTSLGLSSQMPVIHLILTHSWGREFLLVQESHKSWIIAPWFDPIPRDCLLTWASLTNKYLIDLLLSMCNWQLFFPSSRSFVRLTWLTMAEFVASFSAGLTRILQVSILSPGLISCLSGICESLTGS